MRSRRTKNNQQRPKVENPKTSEGSRKLLLTGAIVPAGYDVHNDRYRQAKKPGPQTTRSEKASENPLSSIAPPAHLDKVPAGALGKRPATWKDVEAISAKVRLGEDASSLVAAVYLTEQQREVISAANRQYAFQFHGSKRKMKRWNNRGANDIFRRGIRVSGSFQGNC